MTQYVPSKLGCLAQAIDEGIPEGVTGIDAAKAVADFLNERGWVIEPKTWRCDSCDRTFGSAAAKARHRMDVHIPHRKLNSKERPANLGNIPCGIDDCNQSFANEWNAKQHRKMVHNAECLDIAIAHVLGGGAKKQRRVPSGRLQRQNSPSCDGCTSACGTRSRPKRR